MWSACLESRYITSLPHGRITIARTPTTRNRFFIHLTYTSRAFEWLPLWQIFTECLTAIKCDDLLPKLEAVCFGWRYLPPISSVCYHPFFVFCEFSITSLLADNTTCACATNRFKPFLDNLTMLEHHHQPDSNIAHVWTMNLDIIHNRFLRDSFASGMNHIILQPLTFQDALQEILAAWVAFCDWLQLDDDQTISEGTHVLHNLCYKRWRHGFTNNINCHRRHQLGTLPIAPHRPLTEPKTAT